MNSRDRRQRTNGLSPLVISLLFQLYQQLERSEYKPPVTIGLLALNLYVHLHPAPEIFGYVLNDISANCLHPLRMLWLWRSAHEIAWNRLLGSSLIHANDMHLYYNMLSLSWKGINLERKLGSAQFLWLVVFSLVVSHSLLFIMTYVLYHFAGFDDYSSGFNICAIGFSAVLFSLKYVWNATGNGYSVVMGIQVPTKYAAWLELVVVSIVTPQASFLGHLAGILAGFLYVNGPVEFLLFLPMWFWNLGRKLFVSSPLSSSVHNEDDVVLEDVDDLRRHADRYGTDPTNVQYPDETTLRQQRLRRFNARQTR
jgi:rhomboid domain-containing protein 1